MLCGGLQKINLSVHSVFFFSFSGTKIFIPACLPSVGNRQVYLPEAGWFRMKPVIKYIQCFGELFI